MKYKKFSELDIRLSEIVFGCAGQSMLNGENTDELLDAAIEQGITVFDTAENYGNSEKVLGDWVYRRGNRDKIAIITKGCHPYDGKSRVNIDCLRHDLEQSLERLKTDYIDMYFLHRDDVSMPVGPIMETLNEYYDKGFIKSFGGSNWSIERIIEANEYARENGLKPMTVSSPNYGLCRQMRDPWGGGTTLTGDDNAAERKWYEDNQMPVFAHSSVGRGVLSGKIKSTQTIEEAKKMLDEFAIKGFLSEENMERLKRAEELASVKKCSVSQIALSWALSSKMNVFTIVSCSSTKRLLENVVASDLELTEDERNYLYKGI